MIFVITTLHKFNLDFDIHYSETFRFYKKTIIIILLHYIKTTKTIIFNGHDIMNNIY